MNYIHIYFYLLIFLISCKSPTAPDITSVNLFIYIAGDNNLYKDAIKNINDMEKAVNDNINVIVYFDSAEGYSVIFEVQKDYTDSIKSKIVASYNKDNSANPETLDRFLNYCFKNYNAKETGIVLWSHGSGFLPVYYEENINTMSFGLDNNDRMDIKDLSKILNKYKSDFLIFDACYMADIETIYEIRTTSKYILASQTEILAAGYPYFNVINTLSENDNLINRLKQLCYDYYNYYNSKENEFEKSASISLIDTSKINFFSKKFVDFYNEVLDKYGIEALTNYIDSVQQAGDNSIYRNKKYDMMDWSITIGNNYDNIQNFNEFTASYSNTIIYNTNTEYMFSTFSIDKCSGLNFYIPYMKDDYAYNYYIETSWNKEVKFDKIF